MTYARMSYRDILTQVASGTADKIGLDFLHGLVDALKTSMSASFVFLSIGEGAPPTAARVICSLRDGAPGDSFVYDLVGTPCKLTYEGSTVTVPHELADDFPREADFESYCGCPLHDRDGRVVGNIAVFSKDEIADPSKVQSILQIFAMRAEAELQRLVHDEERQKLINDLVSANCRLSAAHLATREANAFKTRLLGIIAHDLRNPLAVVLAQADLAQTQVQRQEPDLEKLDAIIEKLIGKVEQVSDLITATLTRVRDEDRNLSLQRASVDLSQICEMACEANRSPADSKSITLTCDVEAAAPVEVDAELMVLAVDNLISNAVKYTHPGGNVRVVAEGQKVSVIDDGQGLTDGDLVRAFGRFETLSAKPTGGESSTGLGLANVREIVEAHGGCVAVKSDGVGKGATFSISL